MKRKAKAAAISDAEEGPVSSRTRHGEKKQHATKAAASKKQNKAKVVSTPVVHSPMNPSPPIPQHAPNEAAIQSLLAQAGLFNPNAPSAMDGDDSGAWGSSSSGYPPTSPEESPTTTMESYILELEKSNEELAQLKISHNVDGDILQRLASDTLQQWICPCGTPFMSTGLDVIKQARAWLSDQRHSAWIAPRACEDCSVLTCLCCLQNGVKPNHACRLSKLFKSHYESVSYENALSSIWVVLCGLDELVMKTPAARKRTATKKKNSHAPNPKGTGYGGSENYGMGLGGHSASPASDESQQTKEQRQIEGAVTRAMTLITALLPSIPREEASSTKLAVLLSRSQVLEVVAEYLRNDALQEVASRNDLYMSLIRFMNSLATLPPLIRLCIDPRPVRQESKGLLHTSFGSDPPKKRSTNKKKVVEVEGEERPSLLASLQNLSIQCSIFEKTADRGRKSLQDKESQYMLEFCQQVKLLQDLLQSSDTSSLTNAGIRTSRERFSEDDWFRDFCILDVPDDAILDSPTYSMASTVKKTTSSSSGRMKRLLYEVATLKTSLPPGIFVRHELSRPDILKVLIIGPGGTPYENGGFEFDFFCPADYPSRPPIVNFKQTGHGRESMNPNLYPDGKVCLSLLGTWNGEPWRAGKSTLLQVLLSLQAMVFCAEPYYNEPGWSSVKQDAASKSYNCNLYRATTDVAMLEWLDGIQARAKPKAKPGIWDEVLLHHFSTHAEAILETVKGWATEVDEINQAAKAAIQNQSGQNGNSDQTTPPATMWTHYGMGKDQLDKLIPRLEKGLEAIVAMAEENASDSVPQYQQHAIKSPVELVPEKSVDRQESGGKGRGKRRKL